MTFEEFEKAKPGELREAAKNAFDRAAGQGSGWIGSPSTLLESQFYMAERDRRAGSWIALRDLVLEIVVIALIGTEIWLAVRQGRDEGILMDKQNAILTDLQKSTADNAASIRALVGVTQAMSDATAASGKTLSSVDKGVQGQIALFYDPSISMVYAQDQNRLLFNNTGRSNVKVNSVQVDNQMNDKLGTKMIAVGSSLYLEIEKQAKAISSALPKGSARTLPVEMHLENELRKHFLFKGSLFFIWEGDKVAIHSQTASLQPEP